jgi:hypothetical protein
MFVVNCIRPHDFDHLLTDSRVFAFGRRLFVRPHNDDSRLSVGGLDGHDQDAHARIGFADVDQHIKK